MLKEGNQVNFLIIILGATFFKSDDNLFIFKAVKDSEFFMFYNFAPGYFEHMFKHLYENNPSVLIKIFGMFEKRYKNNSLYFIVMENLFYGMPSERSVYDLKGSETKRWNRKGGSTLLDTNYIIDQNGEPLPVTSNNYSNLF
jgi:hypothetical protein